MGKICFQKAPGQDLAQDGRFPVIPEGAFNCRPRGLQMAEICFQTAPGQALAQKGRFPRVPEGNFNCRPKGPHIAEICFQKALGQVFGFREGAEEGFGVPERVWGRF
jgi:hypothetical protein